LIADGEVVKASLSASMSKTSKQTNGQVSYEYKNKGRGSIHSVTIYTDTGFANAKSKP
jgi:hypothetical protein